MNRSIRTTRYTRLGRVLGLAALAAALSLFLAYPQPAYCGYTFAGSVPNYHHGQYDSDAYFQHAAAPWEVGMALGYWAGKAVPNPNNVPALAGRTFWNIWGPGITYQTAENATIDGLICSTGHRNDYELPEETEPVWQYGVVAPQPSILNDKSSLGGAHADNCLADYLKTSQSVLGLAYGQTQMASSDNKLFAGIEDYLVSRKPYVGNYTVSLPTSGWGTPLDSTNWPSFKQTINNQQPVLISVRVNPDGLQTPDTVLIGAGYLEGSYNEYHCLENRYVSGQPVTQQRYHTYVNNGLVEYFPVFGWTPLVVSLTPSFTDVPVDYWDWEYIEACADPHAGIVGGFGDGTFRPTLVVSRAAMAVFVARAVAGGDANVPAGPPTAHFPDVPTSDWAYKYIEYCYAQGIVQGYGDGLYHPEYAVTRDQMAVFIARGLPWVAGAPGVSPKPVGDAYFQNPANYTPSGVHFTDVPSDYWAYRYIEYFRDYSNNAQLRYGAIGVGYADGSYHPTETVTRDQMAGFLWKGWRYYKE